MFTASNEDGETKKGQRVRSITRISPFSFIKKREKAGVFFLLILCIFKIGLRAFLPAPSTVSLYNFNFSTCSLILSNSSMWIVSSCNLAYSSLANATFSAL